MGLSHTILVRIEVHDDEYGTDVKVSRHQLSDRSSSERTYHDSNVHTAGAWAAYMMGLAIEGAEPMMQRSSSRSEVRP